MYTWLKHSNSLRTSERKLKFHQQSVQPTLATAVQADAELPKKE